MIIVFDTETTGLLAPLAAGQEHQPHLVDLVALKYTNDLILVGELHIRCKPKIEIPKEAIDVHHITNADVADCPAFVSVYDEICKFFLGSEYLVGHNLQFDKLVLYWELVRIGKTLQFPFAPGAICTAEVSQGMKGYRLNLTDLHLELFGTVFSGAHSASVDCEVTAKCFSQMVRQGLIKL